MKHQHAQAGLTLVELLVAMALIGIVFAMITNWQVSTLNISTRTNATSQRLSDLNDVTGYVGDRVRAALRVRTATSGLSVNTGTGATCATERPCLAVVLPDPNDNGQINKYVLYVYRIDPRSVLNADDKVTDTWAETNVAVLREYRSTDPSSSGGGSTPSNCIATPEQFEKNTFVNTVAAPNNVTNCTTMQNLSSATNFTGMQPFLVADYLTPVDELGSGVVPFAHAPTTKSMTLTLQTKQQVQGRIQLTPATPYTLTVQARNVP